VSFPKVSIVTVNWNGVEDTKECLESLKRITYPNYEVIVVDNGSKGEDVRILKEDFGGYIYLIQNDKNYGYAKGCNAGINEALSRRADYVVLLNNDTVVASDFLEEVIKVMQRDTKAGIAGGMIYLYENPQFIWSAGGFINPWTGNLLGQQARDESGQSNEVEWVVGCYMLISRQVLQIVGMLDERFFFSWEDVDLCVRAAKKGFKILFIPGSKIWHKGFAVGKRERLAGRPVYYATKGRFIFMEKNYTKLQLAISTLYFLAVLPKRAWEYSLLLQEWKTPVYILWGFFDYLRRK
jgi:hypothetical protein